MAENLNSYKIFYSVAEKESISKAAKSLYLSQPAVSAAIKKLEDELEVKLFIRESKGVVLTEEGKTLFDHLTKAFNEISEAENSIKLMSAPGAGHISIGVSTTLCKHALLPYLKTFIKENPQVQIKINCQSTIETLKQIEDNTLDMGLVAKPKFSKGICYTPLMKIKETFVASPDYLEHFNSLHLDDENADLEKYFEQANIMMLDKTNQTRQIVDEVLSANNIHFNNSIEVSTMDLLIEFAKTGLGIACVIKTFVEEELKTGTLVEVPALNLMKKREIGFAYKKHALSNSAIAEFLKLSKNPED